MRGGIIAARAGLAGEEQAIVHRRGELGTAVSLARQCIRVGAARERVDAPTMKLQRLHQNRCRAFHDPEFWKALAIARKWEDTNAWRFHWHRFIDHLADGKDAESFLPLYEKHLNAKRLSEVLGVSSGAQGLAAPHRLQLRGSDRALLVWMTWLWPSLLGLLVGSTKISLCIPKTQTRT